MNLLELARPKVDALEGRPNGGLCGEEGAVRDAGTSLPYASRMRKGILCAAAEEGVDFFSLNSESGVFS